MSLLSTPKLNIILIDSDEVIHLIWRNGRLNFHENYSVDQHGFDRFHVFLENDSKTPFAIILDVIEEDFRIETVAHVTGSDREAMLSRKLAHIFRTTPYRTARVVGRETHGRKDDRILLTGLTKPEIVSPWISRILDNQVPLQSITSAAYIMELFAQRLKFSNESHLLMVNQEANSGLRQTYLQKGRVVFSRLTPTSVSQSDDFSELIFEQCDQTRKYLERIKQLPYDTDLKVHVFTSEKFNDQQSIDREHLHYKFHAINEMPLSRKINLVESAPSAIAYSLISILRKRKIPNIYASSRTRRFAIIKQIKSILYTGSVIAVLSAMIVVAPTMLDTNSKWQMEAEVAQQTAPLLEEYQKLTDRFPETPIPSGQMEMVVETVDAILGQVFYPQEILAYISQGLEEAPELLISSIEWELVSKQAPAMNQDVMLGETLTDAEQLQNAIVAGETVLVTTVQGLVQSEGSIRDATAQVNLFADTIAQHSNLNVTVLSQPMEVRSDINVATTIDGSGARGEFTIEIREELVNAD